MTIARAPDVPQSIPSDRVEVGAVREGVVVSNALPAWHVSLHARPLARFRRCWLQLLPKARGKRWQTGRAFSQLVAASVRAIGEGAAVLLRNILKDRKDASAPPLLMAFNAQFCRGQPVACTESWFQSVRSSLASQVETRG